MEPIPVAAWVCGSRLLGLRVWIPPKGRGDGWISVSVVCCQVEVSATGWSLDQRSPTEYVWLSVISKPQQWGGLDPPVLSIRENKNWNFGTKYPQLYIQFCSCTKENIANSLSYINIWAEATRSKRPVWHQMKRLEPLVASCSGRSATVVKCWFSASTVLESGEETTMNLPSPLLARATTFNRIIISHSVIYQTRNSDIDTRNISVWLLRH
jgi:hypothetical protein